MKKLGTLAVLLSLGLFSVGCQKADTGAANGNGASETAPADDAGAGAPAEGSGAGDEAAEGAE